MRTTILFLLPGLMLSPLRAEAVDRRIPTITLELPHDLRGPDCWAENGEALLAAIRGERPFGN